MELNRIMQRLYILNLVKERKKKIINLNLI